MMESYFVRTLGMHRVYNSAFMNILRDEDNAKYRLIIKNTLEYDPEILKRFVNFMNNPDERTAIDQFGDGDKYFGICTLMATMPGLPMFGHGQIEGFSEKYGMEYKKAYWDETPRSDLIYRHERQIFPLLHRRAEFAGIELFRLFDFYTDAGTVNENVYAYTNGLGNQHNLVVYHNKFANTSGTIRTSAVFNPKDGSGTMQQTDLASALELSPHPNTYVILRDQSSNLEYLRNSQEIAKNGLFVDLHAYQCHTFVDIRQVQDDEYASYKRLYEYLGGRGVPNIQQALAELLLQPVLNPFQQIANRGYFQYLLGARCGGEDKQQLVAPLLEEADSKYAAFLDGIQSLTNLSFDRNSLQKRLTVSLDVLLSWLVIDRTHYPLPGGKTYQAALTTLKDGLDETPERWLILFAFLFVRDIGRAVGEINHAEQSLSLFQEWRLSNILKDCYQEFGSTQEHSSEMVNIIQLLIREQDWLAKRGKTSLDQCMNEWLSMEEIQRFLGVNRHKGILWYDKESFEEFVWWMTANAVLAAVAKPDFNANTFVELILSLDADVQTLMEAKENSKYQVALLLESLND
ncbi:MAG: hypothetical protein K8R77_07360 [Anaerolineaceae bacterium]|nr:hypothetical protein [Anaerolineaceae bacterium]